MEQTFEATIEKRGIWYIGWADAVALLESVSLYFTALNRSNLTYRARHTIMNATSSLMKVRKQVVKGHTAQFCQETTYA